MVAKHDAKKEAKIGANLEAKIDTYLEVKHGAKWDAKVVAKMDVILDANLDANMALLMMKIWHCQGCHLRVKSGHSLGSKIWHYLRRKPQCCLGSKVGRYSGSKKIEVILDVIKDAI